MSCFFKFEDEFVASLRCIPMQVRFKLDTCGIKLKLHQWNQFEINDRQALINRPCETSTEVSQYRDFLQVMIQERTGETASSLAIDPHPPWDEATTLPVSVTEKAESLGQQISIEQWAGLSALERFALIKLSRSGHENSNFLPALEEFGLA